MSSPAPRETDPTRGRTLWVSAYVLLGLALVSLVLAWAGVLIVVGPYVAPTSTVALVLVLVGTVTRVVLRTRRVPAPGWGGRWVLPTITLCAWVLVPATAAWDQVGSPSYVLAEPAGSGGCRVVVVESSFLFAGWGSVHVAGGWGPFAPRLGTYRTDDGARPASTGDFSLSWNDSSGGNVRVGATLPNQRGGDSGSFELDC